MIDVWRHKWHLTIVTFTKDLFVGAKNIIELLRFVIHKTPSFYLSFVASVYVHFHFRYKLEKETDQPKKFYISCMQGTLRLISLCF